MEDPYVTLGLKRDASQDDIRAAYRKLAKQHHPDLNPGNAAAEAKFKTVAAANELLSDPDKRARFDRGELDAAGQERPSGPSYREQAESTAGQRYSRAGPQSQAWNEADFSDLFGSMFNQGRRPNNGPRPGEDQRYTLTAAFLDAVNGATRRLTLPDGRTLDVKIPAGTAQGQVLRLRGQGGNGVAGGPGGDALIEIDIASHRFFERRGNDISFVLPVTLAEAALGGSVQVPTPAGPVMMRIPSHSDSGNELRLRGRGVPKHGGAAAGDLHATLRVMVGPSDPALEAFLKTWKPAQPFNPRAEMEESS
ncbi:DnaJ-class molecular chaperone [Devosia sp. UYZn731]|uniref:DnaJ C-terminal domain-containing protein n=1 Tax=Devosia sp. UYZn731 TaxID=3156345 RepID=UPI0033941C1B